MRSLNFLSLPGWLPAEDWSEVDSLALDQPGRIDPHPDPYAMEDSTPTPSVVAATPAAAAATVGAQPVKIVPASARIAERRAARAKTVIRLPSFEDVSADAVLCAHASRVFHLESNPGNARALVQAHGSGPGRRDESERRLVRSKHVERSASRERARAKRA